MGTIFNTYLTKLNSYLDPDLRSQISYYFTGECKIRERDNIKIVEQDNQKYFIGNSPIKIKYQEKKKTQ